MALAMSELPFSSSDDSFIDLVLSSSQLVDLVI